MVAQTRGIASGMKKMIAPVKVYFDRISKDL
jgi:hypothetical protein